MGRISGVFYFVPRCKHIIPVGNALEKCELLARSLEYEKLLYENSGSRLGLGTKKNYRIFRHKNALRSEENCSFLNANKSSTFCGG